MTRPGGQSSTADRPRFFGIETENKGARSGNRFSKEVVGLRVAASFCNHLLVDSGGRPLLPSNVSREALRRLLLPEDRIFAVRLGIPGAGRTAIGQIVDPGVLAAAEAAYASPRATANLAVRVVENVLKGAPLVERKRSGGLIFRSGPEPISDRDLAEMISSSEVFEDGAPPRDANDFVEDVGELTAVVLGAVTGSPDLPAQTCEIVEVPALDYIRT